MGKRDNHSEIEVNLLDADSSLSDAIHFATVGKLSHELIEEILTTLKHNNRALRILASIQGEAS